MMLRILPIIEPLEPRIAPAFSSIVDVALLDGTDGFKVSRPTPVSPDGFATALSGIGDFNHDGIDDFVVSAPIAGNGSLYVVFGNPDVTPASVDVTTLNGTNGFRIDGAGASDLAGATVSPAGDLNGDGIDDFILGAPGTGNNRGAAYILFGQGTALPATFTLGSGSGINVLQLNGETVGDRAGASVDALGDFNKDGYDDVIIGAPQAINGLGAAYMIFGKSGSGSAVANLSAVDGTVGFRLLGELDHTRTGGDVAGLHDINNDGYDDLAVGSSFDDPAPGSTSYVVFGHSGPFNTNFLLNSVDGATSFKINGGVFPGKGRHLSAAGDINDDGYDDFLLSSAIVKNGQTFAAAFAIYGHNTPFDASFNLASLDGSNGFRVNFGKFKQLTFTSVAAAGDVNGDGISDFMVGSAGFRGKPVAGMDADNGTSYVIFGRNASFDNNNPFDKVFDASTLELGGGFSIVNDPSTEFFVTALNPASDINGDGHDDILIGSGKVGDLGAAYAVFGQAVYIATDPSSNEVKFNDTDGDVISVVIPGHKLKQANFTFHQPSGSSLLAGPVDDSFFDLTLSADFAHAKVKIKTTQAGGDGSLRVGRIDATGFALKSIKVSGDVDAINVGSGTVGSNAIGTFTVQNLGPAVGLGHSDLLGTVKLLKIHGAMRNTTMAVGGGVASGLKKLVVTGSITNSHVISSGKLDMSIAGDLTDSTIDAATSIRSLTVSGDVVNTTIRALGDGGTAKAAESKVVKHIGITGSIENSHILAGYDANGMLMNGQARFGSIKVKHDWTASDLVAGVAAGNDTFFGTADDTAMGGGGFISPSRIASIIIQGQIFGSATVGDTFGFVAEEIAKFNVGGAAIFTPTPGPNNDLAILTFGPDGDVAEHEVTAPV